MSVLEHGSCFPSRLIQSLPNRPQLCGKKWGKVILTLKKESYCKMYFSVVHLPLVANLNKNAPSSPFGLSMVSFSFLAFFIAPSVRWKPT